jgi:hypothetical protein
VGTCLGEAVTPEPPPSPPPPVPRLPAPTARTCCACALAAPERQNGAARAGVTWCAGQSPRPTLRARPAPAPPLSRRDARRRRALRRPAVGECPRGARVAQTRAGPGGGAGRLDASRGPREQNGGGVHPSSTSHTWECWRRARDRCWGRGAMGVGGGGLGARRPGSEPAVRGAEGHGAVHPIVGRGRGLCGDRSLHGGPSGFCNVRARGVSAALSWFDSHSRCPFSAGWPRGPCTPTLVLAVPRGRQGRNGLSILETCAWRPGEWSPGLSPGRKRRHLPLSRGCS